MSKFCIVDSPDESVFVDPFFDGTGAPRNLQAPHHVGPFGGIWFYILERFPGSNPN